MFSKSLELTLNSAFARAREKRHEFITVEHLLLSLLDNPEASAVLVACGANLDRLRVGLGIFIDETTPHVPMNVERDIQPTLSFQRVLQRAIYQVQTTGRPEVTGTNVLTAIFGEQESQAVYFLSQENVTRMDVVNYLTQGVTRQQDSGTIEKGFSTGEDISSSSPSMDASSPQIDSPSTKEGTSEESLVEMYTVNLNERANLGKIDPLIGRNEEVMRSIQVLCRRSKNNPLFVGEAGVGKTAIAEGLAQMIVQNKVPKALAGCTVYSLDLGVMLAGTKYRGDFEKRFKSVLKALGRHTGAIVFIDEIHNLIGAGSATGGTMDASNLIKPILSAGELRCMGATTYEEYRNFFAKDNALMRRFQKIDVVEPSVEDTIKIIKGLQSRFERYHDVKYTNEAISRAVELSSRYLQDRHLPDKAIDVIDEAGAYQQIQPGSKAKRVIDTHEVEEIIAKMARIPVQQVSATDKQTLKRLPLKLKKRVFGQDHAIEVLCDAIKLSRSGLRELNKPVGSFLLAGPTGVGKTEVTRQLAEQLGVELVRFDMSEYMEKHTVSRMIGAPPGYVGYDQGGLLTEAVIKHPHCVLLLDEIEKAHQDLFNILLQVMDYGQLTDNNGRKADFKHVIIIMTTNAGAAELERNTIGFSRDDRSEDSMAAINRLFTPEFRNRLDAIVPFNHLDTSTINQVIEKCLKELRESLGQKSVRLSISAHAKAWLATHGYDRKMGARPMARLIQEKIKKPLAEELLFGRLADRSGMVRIGVDKEELSIKIQEAESEETV
jgi:ATP-dependent Clp protease ATP-binding subunit ClpA